MNKRQMILFKIIILSLGSIIAGVGMSLALSAKMGGATISIFWQGLSGKLGVDIGAASYITALAMIAFVFFYDRSQIHIGTIINQTLYSVSLSIFGKFFIWDAHIAVRVILVIVGLAILSFGVGLYSSPNLGRGSYEALYISVADKNGWQIKYVRMVFDGIFVVIGLIMGGTIGICTICAILMNGPIVQFVKEKAERRLFHIDNPNTRKNRKNN